MTVGGATVVVVGAGYPGKRRALARLAELGARLVIVDEPGHWSAQLVDEGIASQWIGAPVTGDPDVDADAIIDALTAAGVRPDGALTFWEDSICTCVRVAAVLGLPANSVDAVDSARSKVRMRERSAALGLPTPRARRVRSLDELYAASTHVGFPAVVKPEFGASAIGCVKVESADGLPGVYSLVRSVVTPAADGIFRAGNDLILEEYLDGVEFDVDLVMHRGECVFSSVSQNWPTREPSFQETGLHCPADHDRKEVRRLVDLTVQIAQRFGLDSGVLHIEGKCTRRGPRIVEVNARMGGGRIHEIVERVWGVDLIEAQLRASLDLPPNLQASRKPMCAVTNVIVHATGPGTLADPPAPAEAPAGCMTYTVDVDAEVGDEVVGPEAVFATVLAEVTLFCKDLRTARAAADAVLSARPRIESVGDC